MSNKRIALQAVVSECHNASKKTELDVAESAPVCNQLQFDSSSSYEIHEISVKYRQRVLSQYVSETTNSNSVLEWKSIEFPGKCSAVSLSPNERFVVAKENVVMQDNVYNLALYDLHYDSFHQLNPFDLNYEHIRIRAVFEPFYWVNDDYLCVRLEYIDCRDHVLNIKIELCLLNVKDRNSYLLKKKMRRGKVFAVNNHQFVLIGEKQVEYFDISQSLHPYKISVFDFNSEQDSMLCAYDQCTKLQQIEKNCAAVLMPIFPIANQENTVNESMRLYLLDLTTFRCIDLKLDAICNGVHHSLQFIFNKTKQEYNWSNDTVFYAVYDSDSTAMCAIYKFQVDIDAKRNYSVRCTELMETEKEFGSGNKQETVEEGPYLLTHPLSKEDIIVQRDCLYGDYTNIWVHGDPHNITQCHQFTKIPVDGSHAQRYKYPTYREIQFDVLSGLLFVQSEFLPECKKEDSNEWTRREMEKSRTYGLDVINSLNGEKVGFIAVPQIEMDECDEEDVYLQVKFDFHQVRMEFGVNAALLYVNDSKYVHLMMNMHPPQYWTDLLCSTPLFNNDRTIADLVGQYLCYNAR